MLREVFQVKKNDNQRKTYSKGNKEFGNDKYPSKCKS